MRSPLILILPLALLAGLAFLLRDADPTGPAAAEPVPETAPDPPRDSAVVPAEPETRGRSAEPLPAEGDPDPEARPEAPVASGPVEEAPGESADLTATQALEVRVVDRLGAPVMDARVWIMGHRSEGRPGTYFSYRGDPPEGRTDFDGRAELEHFSWVDQDGRVSAVDLHVEHPDFVPFRDPGFPAEAGLHVVTLERGATVTLTAWIGSPDEVVTDLTFRADWDSDVGAGDWTLDADGRWTTTRFAAGRHAIRVAHESERHGTCYSRRVDFELDAGGYEDLIVELSPALTFEGALDPRVPRPVIDGIALLSVHSLDEWSGPTLALERRTTIDASGTFVFEDLPPGEGQILALCRGWVSERRALPVDDRAIAIAADPATPMAGAVDAIARELELQAVALPQSEPYVVPMERTGELSVRLVTPEGEPIVDGAVSTNPNYSLFGVGSSIVPGREWHARTGPDGRALVVDLPATDALFVSAGHARFQLREAERLAMPSVAILPGVRAELELVLEPKP